MVFEKFKAQYQEYLDFGGFPQVVLANSKDLKVKYLQDIFNSYYEKEIRILGDFRNLSSFKELLFLLIERAGTKLEYGKLASELKVSRDSIYSYINFLESTYFVNLVPPFSRNPDREVSGAKKIYICDTGILKNLGNVSEGSLLENSVFLNLKKFGKINYYQKRSGAEIDFIIKDIHSAFEVKRSGNLIDLKKLKSISQTINFNEFYMITKNYFGEENVIIALDL